MYLHLGNQVIALQKSVIGVFDMDTATWSYRTRETLEKLEQAGQVENAAGTELPKSLLARQRPDMLSLPAQHRNII